MKQKISITIEKEKLEIIKMLLDKGRFRNRSHIIEYGLDKFLEEENQIKGDK